MWGRILNAHKREDKCIYKGDDWEEKKWGELCHFVRGPFGGSLKKSMFKESGYVVYEQKHAIYDRFDNELAGWTATMDILIYNDIRIC